MVEGRVNCRLIEYDSPCLGVGGVSKRLRSLTMEEEEEQTDTVDDAGVMQERNTKRGERSNL